MSINKDLFSEHLQNKDYNFCISLLRTEIIDILTKKVQEKCPNFKYTTLSILKNYCIKYLDDSAKGVVIELFHLSFDNEITSSFELARIMDLYNDLI